MLFQTPAFFCFFLVVYFFYRRLKLRGQNLLLLCASYLFYSFWDYRFLALLLISTTVDFYAAQKIEHSSNQRSRKAWLGLSLLANFTILGTFKYHDFFASSFCDLLQAFGIQTQPHLLRLILPVGVSFYTFQEIGYTIDVYRRSLKAERDFVSFALFVAYFPHMVAGPIMRAEKLLEQIRKPRLLTTNQIRTGLMLFFMGYVRKVGVADLLSPYVDSVFANYAERSTLDLWLALYGFAIQIYCDFSGYSLMARGVSRILGIELMVNFDLPYFSRSVGEFWRRWHISLSTWFRDYVYVPLGGNRVSRLRNSLNLMIVFALSGLWHGANLTFLVWGLLHGFYLIAWRAISLGWSWLGGREQAIPSWLAIPFTFHLVLLTWVFFRAPHLSAATGFIRGLFSLNSQFPLELGVYRFACAAMLYVLIELPELRFKNREFTWQFAPVLRGAYVGTLLVILFLSPEVGNVSFIYFQF